MSETGHDPREKSPWGMWVPLLLGLTGGTNGYVRFLLTRSYDWLNTDGEALVKRKDPNEYLRKLRFHRKVKSYRDYGLGEH